MGSVNISSEFLRKSRARKKQDEPQLAVVASDCQKSYQDLLEVSPEISLRKSKIGYAVFRLAWTT